jgi:hypothetical protein
MSPTRLPAPVGPGTPAMTALADLAAPYGTRTEPSVRSWRHAERRRLSRSTQRRRCARPMNRAGRHARRAHTFCAWPRLGGGGMCAESRAAASLWFFLDVSVGKRRPRLVAPCSRSLIEFRRAQRAPVHAHPPPHVAVRARHAGRSSRAYDPQASGNAGTRDGDGAPATGARRAARWRLDGRPACLTLRPPTGPRHDRKTRQRPQLGTPGRAANCPRPAQVPLL